nr:hypothetical protein [Nitrosomonas nitrosa]
MFGNPSAPNYQWLYVERRFAQFLESIQITTAQAEDGNKKQAGVRDCLNRHYWNVTSETENSFLIGSWGKLTRVRPSRDVDILFLLPPHVFHQFEGRVGNRQSQLLQDVKEVLRTSYSQTTMRGDGQVVVIPFNTTPIEVAPGFRCSDGRIIVCDSNDGGRYITSTAEAEAADLGATDTLYNGNVRALARMMKHWQRAWDVPLKSFQIERLAVEFLHGWYANKNGLFWYDWMVRDFLAFLQGRAGGVIWMPGTGEQISLGSDWLFNAQRAYALAVTACAHERGNDDDLAGQAWQEIFGAAVPRRVS